MSPDIGDITIPHDRSLNADIQLQLPQGRELSSLVLEAAMNCSGIISGEEFFHRDGNIKNPVFKDLIQSTLHLYDWSLRQVRIPASILSREEVMNSFDIFLRQVLPRIIIFSAGPREDGFPSNLDISIMCTIETFLAQLLENRRINFMSVLCPPYHYGVRPNNRGDITSTCPLFHIDGQILPTIGPGFHHAASAMHTIWEPLTTNNTQVDWHIFHYSGNRGIEGLVEIGADTLKYYKTNP